MPNPTKKEIKAAFKLADKDGNGKLTAKEVKELIRGLGEDVDIDNIDDMLKMFINMADKDGDKMVNLDEVVELMCGEPDEMEKARSMFKMWDADGNGKLSKKELVEMCKTMGKTMGNKGTDIFMVMADEDGDGMVSFKEFCALMNIN